MEPTSKTRARRRSPPGSQRLAWLAGLALCLLLAKLAACSQRHRPATGHRRHNEIVRAEPEFGLQERNELGAPELEAFVEARHAHETARPEEEEADDDAGLSLRRTLDSSGPNQVEFRRHVPEQSPIVVSSSDNSYVSASPIVAEQTTAPTTTTIEAREKLSSRRESQPPFTQTTSELASGEPAAKSGRHRASSSQKHSNQHHKSHQATAASEQTRTRTQTRRQWAAGQRDFRQSTNSDISTTATTTERSKDARSVVQRRASWLSRRKAAGWSPGTGLRDSDTGRPSLEPTSGFNRSTEVKAEMVASFAMKQATIIKTRESMLAGATFINYTIVSSLDACLVECWITDSCDTAIYQESPVDFNNHLPENSPEQEQQQQEHHDSLLSLQTSTFELEPLAKDESIESETDRRRDQDDEEDEAQEEEEEAARNNRAQSLGGSEILSNQIAADSMSRRRRSPQTAPGFYICYLFECAKADGFKCQFSPHDYYVSAVRQSTIRSEALRAQPLPASFIKTLRPSSNQDDDDEDDDDQRSSNQFTMDGSSEDEPLSRGFLHQNHVVEPKYSKIVQRSHQGPSLNGRRKWAHVASIQIGEEEYKDYAARGGLNSALIAIMIGIAATGMLILVVGHKMSSIKRRIAYKGRRRSIVPDKDFLINTLPA